MPVGARQLRAAVRAVAQAVRPGLFVIRSDVKQYYASLDHELLMAEVDRVVQDRGLRDLIWSGIRRCTVDGGEYRDVNRGISLGSALSPLLGALFLRPLDARMRELGVFYARYMDDWVVLAPTRWKLRAASRAMNEVLEKHPDKTFLGRVERRFDFLGFEFSTSGVVGTAKQTVDRFVERATRLYEQGAGMARIGEYAARWAKWVGGVMGVPAVQGADQRGEVVEKLAPPLPVGDHREHGPAPQREEASAPPSDGDPAPSAASGDGGAAEAAVRAGAGEAAASGDGAGEGGVWAAVASGDGGAAEGGVRGRDGEAAAPGDGGAAEGGAHGD